MIHGNIRALVDMTYSVTRTKLASIRRVAVAARVGLGAYGFSMGNRQVPEWVALSAPSPGRPLVPAIERLARPVRQAASILEGEIDIPFDDLYAPRRTGLGYNSPTRARSHRSAWALIGEWLVAASSSQECARNGLAATHDWFWQGANQSLGSFTDYQMDACVIAGSNELHALMPYLLDPHAAATRRDVIKSPSSSAARRARKASGVYYTPGDVAYLMVEAILDHVSDKRQTWLDPAQGSGVFLRAILSAVGWDSVGANLYGVDVDPQAAEATSFVLTAEDLIQRPEGPPPWSRWHEFRRNLATGDALFLDASGTSGPWDESRGGMHWSGVRLDADVRGKPLGNDGPWCLGRVFPEVARGFDRVVANPPYAPLPPTGHSYCIPLLHPVAGPSAAQDISPVFIELSGKLLAPDGVMSLVTPLSVITSTRAPFPAIRKYLLEQVGRLSLLSFDRAPDALFGDDIKTRNAIVQLDRRGCSEQVTVSPLFRWTSRNRREALRSVPTISITKSPGLAECIPKIGFHWENSLYRDCLSHPVNLVNWVVAQTQASLPDLPESPHDINATVIAIAPTAYNFLGVIREPLRAVMDGHDARNRFSVLTFPSDRLAAAAYAIMSSRLALWLWHVTGDGFHVTTRLTRLVPCTEERDSMVDRLADLGDALWKKASQQSVVSRNGGRATVAYPTWPYTSLLDAIDRECGVLLGCRDVTELRDWHRRLVVVHPEPKREALTRRMD